MTRYGMAINVNHCVGCQTCVVSCQLENALRPGSKRGNVDTFEEGRWPKGDLFFFSHACVHCDEPLCVDVCPTGASVKRDDGIVAIEHELCIGCGVCVTACEYGARSVELNEEFYFDADTPAPYEALEMKPVGVADKCDFCFKRVEEGKLPACVSSCIVGVRVFGDLDDPSSEINSFITEHHCKNISDTALYYGVGKRDIDLKDLVTTNYYISAKDVRDQREVDEPKINPTVIGVAGAVTAISLTGLGITARRSRKKRE